MRLTERLLVNGVELPISGYSINTPTDGMGQSVNIALAKPDITSIPLDADITFEIGASKWGGAVYNTSYAPPIISGGKLLGRNYTVRWIPDEKGGHPGDVIEFSSLSPLADKWSISPDNPIILYDPAKVDATKLIPNQSELIRYGTGYITPVAEAEPDLKLHTVLDRAYKEGCGFTRVITNLPNPEIDRVDFSIEGGYHAAAKALIDFMEPLPFEHGGALWIIDPDEGIPTGLTVKTLSPNAVVEVIQTLTPEVISNAVILSYKNRERINAGEYLQLKIIAEPPIESGSGNSYTRIEVLRHVTEHYDILTDELRSTDEHEIETSTFAMRNGAVTLISKETLENLYIATAKDSHTRTIEALYTPPSGGDVWDTVMIETCRLLYEADQAHPGENILTLSETKTRGTVLAETPEGGTTKYTPILDATSGGGGSDNEGIVLPNMAIETIIERLRPTSQNQANVETIIVDHLGGGLRTVAPVQSRTGSRSTYAAPFALERKGGHRPGYIRELIDDKVSRALYGLRRPIGFNVENLDAATGRRLARRKLQKLTKPPKTLKITMPGIDFSLRRGSLILCPLRSGFEGKAIVTGLGVTATGIGTPQARRVQTLDARELLTDVP